MKKALFVAILIASLLVIRSLVVSIYSLWQKQDLVVRTQNELSQEKTKNKEISDKIQQAGSSSFIEEQARNKLFLVKEGEQDILISKKLLDPKDASGSGLGTKSNWKQWVDLFF